MTQKDYRIVPMALLVLLAVLLAACRVVEPAQTAYPALTARRATPQSTRLPSLQAQATAQPTRPPATKSSGRATAVPATAGRVSPRPTAAPASPTPAPTRGDVAFSLTILYTGEVHGEVRPCG